MRYAIIYSSQTGNTKKLAEEIFVDLLDKEKIITEIKSIKDIPEADVYLIGFPIHNFSCNIDVLNILERIENSNIALFATCGLTPKEDYKKRIETTLMPWINENCNYYGMFLCQGKAEKSFIDQINLSMPERYEVTDMFFKESSSHPNDEDFEKAMAELA
mgnify:CR=1 FL=1